jgi:EpsI family protein
MMTAFLRRSINSQHARPAYLAVGAAMLIASGLAVALTPTRHDVPEGTVRLEQSVPSEFGRWKEVKTGYIQMDLAPRDGEERTRDQPYDQTLMRTYVRDDGAMVMLALAYGRTQRQEVKIHRPELCYVAQGFELKGKTPVQLNLGQGVQINAYHLLATNGQRLEPITYWIRIGDEISMNALQSRLAIFKEGLVGRIPDGILVRVSQIVSPSAAPASSFDAQAEFLTDLLAHLDEAGRRALIGRMALRQGGENAS